MKNKLGKEIIPACKIHTMERDCNGLTHDLQIKKNVSLFPYFVVLYTN